MIYRLIDRWNIISLSINLSVDLSNNLCLSLYTCSQLSYYIRIYTHEYLHEQRERNLFALGLCHYESWSPFRKKNIEGKGPFSGSTAEQFCIPKDMAMHRCTVALRPLPAKIVACRQGRSRCDQRSLLLLIL